MKKFLTLLLMGFVNLIAAQTSLEKYAYVTSSPNGSVQYLLSGNTTSPTVNNILGSLASSLDANKKISDYFSYNSSIPTLKVGSSSDVLNSVLATASEPLYSTKSAIKYWNGKPVSFQFEDHVIKTANGQEYKLAVMNSSAIINSILPAGSGNGATMDFSALYNVTYKGTGSSPWLTFSAPSKETEAMITLYAKANRSNGADGAAYMLNMGNGNVFRMSASGNNAIIGFNEEVHTSLTIKSGTIYTAAQFFSSNVLNARTLVASDEPINWQVPEGIKGYFSSSIADAGGILIENKDQSSFAWATSTYKHGTISNYIGTFSTTATSGVRQAGDFIMESKNMYGILLNATTTDSNNGSIRFAVQSQPIASINLYGLIIGQGLQSPTIAFGVYSSGQGAILCPMSDKDMRAMKNVRPGTEIFNEDIQEKCIYTVTGWKVLPSITIEAFLQTKNRGRYLSSRSL